MTETLDLPPIADVLPPQQEAPALPTDLKRIDLQAVALAQFGDWRTDVAAARKNLGTLALDLSIPARIAEAKSLRERVINAPRAQVRKVSKALKSKLAAVSKTIGAEEDAAVLAYDEAETLITPQIEAAEQRIEDERQKKAKEEADRLQALRDTVDAKLAPWVDRCNAEGMTSDRVQAGLAALVELPMPPELADVSAHWAQRLVATRDAMERRRLALAQAEVEAAQAKVRAEQKRVAGIQARIAEIQAAATGRERATAADLLEARTVVAALDVSEAQYQEFALLAQAAQAGTLAVLDKLHAEAVGREAEQQRADDALLAALQAPPEPLCETTTAQPGAQSPVSQEGVGENPLQPQPVADVTAGDVAAVSVAVDEAAVTADDSTAPGVMQEVIGNPPWDGSLETSEADARPYVAQLAAVLASATDPRDEFVALVMSAFDCKFPSHPKPSQEWWMRVRAAGQALQGFAA